MSKPLKVVALLAVLVLLGGIVTGVAIYTLNDDSGTVQPGLYIEDNEVEDPGTMVTVGSHEVSFKQYRFFFSYTKYMISQNMQDASYWDSDPDKTKMVELKTQSENLMKDWYSRMDLAQEQGVELTEEEKQEIQDEMETTKTEQGDQFYTNLEQIGISDDETYIWFMESQKLQEKVGTELQEKYKEEISEELVDTAMSAKHILYSFPEVEGADSTSNGTSSSASDSSETEDEQPKAATQEEAEKTALEEAQQAYEALLLSSENLETAFDTRMNADSDDPGLAEYPDGYIFVEGEMYPEFYEGTKALEVGEMSQPVKSESGYHIILRLPLDEAARDEHMASEQVSSLITQQAQTKVNEMLETIKEELTITGGEYYDQLGIDSIR